MEESDRLAGQYKVGVMLVGALGMSGTAVMAGISAVKRGILEDQYGSTSHRAMARTPLISAKLMELAGWDYHLSSISQRTRDYGHIRSDIVAAMRDDEIDLFRGLWSPVDYPLDSCDFVRYPATFRKAHLVSEDIASFRLHRRCDRVIVVFLGTPARNSEVPPAQFLIDDTTDRAVPSALMYAVGAANSGAHFIDFTPSQTLEFTDLWRHADSCGVQLAGRDGSTGQTMLKVTLAEMLARRGIGVDAWYSTNLIGNRDGLVLSQHEYSATKIADKTDALSASDVGFHRVNIDYCPPWGDRKEAWDAIECTSWLGAPLSIRIDWRGHDSQLAGAVVLDLVRLIDRGVSIGHKGFQPQLGFFSNAHFCVRKPRSLNAGPS